MQAKRKVDMLDTLDPKVVDFLIHPNVTRGNTDVVVVIISVSVILLASYVIAGKVDYVIEVTMIAHDNVVPVNNALEVLTFGTAVVAHYVSIGHVTLSLDDVKINVVALHASKRFNFV